MDEYSVNFPGVLTGHKSRAFESLVRGIGEARSKHEEDKVIQSELIYLKEQFVSAKLSVKKIRELLVRLVYCELLGHDGSFGYIHGIKLAQETTLLEKRTGYIASSLFLHKDHELVLLLINTLQKDLKSTNVVAKSAALNAICKLVGAEMAPALLPLILAALKDKRAEIRKKSLMALQQVYRISPSLVQNVTKLLVQLICDNDPAVMSSTLHFFYDLIKEDPVPYRKYLKAFLQILTQIMESKLPGYNFHGVQAPWIQIKLLKILALLGKQHKSTSDSMSGVLSQMVHLLPTDCNIGCAVMFECIQTITTIYPIKSLLNIASKKASLFLTSDSSNMRCLGITAVTSLAEIDPSYAGDSERQKIIIDCLDDDDMTIKKKTLELLYRITNSENVDLVSSKLLNFLSLTTEYYIKMEVTTKLTELAEKYAPSSLWYIQTINNVIKVADQCIPPQLIHHLMKLISAADDDVKGETVSKYVNLIRMLCLPDYLVQISCWVIGEFAHFIQDNDLQSILCNVTCLLDRKFTDTATRGWVITSIGKLIARAGEYSPEARGIIDRYRTGFPPELRQRCHEITMLTGDMVLMQSVLPVGKDEDIQECSSLSFLDDFVSEALKNGACPYQPQIKKKQEVPAEQEVKSKILIKPYEEPFKKLEIPINEDDSPKPDTSLGTLVGPPTTLPSTSQPLTTVIKKIPKAPDKVWSREGYLGAQLKKQDVHYPKEPLNNRESSSKSSSSKNESSNKEKEVEKSRDETVVLLKTDPVPSHAIFCGVASFNEPSSEDLGQSSGNSTKSRDSEPGDNGSALLHIDENDIKKPPLSQNITQQQNFDRERNDLDSKSLSTNLLLQASENVTYFDNDFSLTTINDELANHSPSGDFLYDSDKGATDKYGQQKSKVDIQKSFKEVNADFKNQFDAKEKRYDDSDLVLTQERNAEQKENEMMSNIVEQSDSLIDFDDSEKTSMSLYGKTIMDDQAKKDNEETSIVGTKDRTLTDSSRNQEEVRTVNILTPTAEKSLNQDFGSCIELCSDSNLRMVCQIGHKPDQLTVEFKLTNHCQSRDSVEKISVIIEPPSNLVANVESNVEIETLLFLDTMDHQVVLTYQYPALHMSLKGTIKYSIKKTSKVLYFTQELRNKELLRPLHITTQQFGEKWTSMTNDVKQSVSMTSPKRCDDVIGGIAKYMNLIVVDIIGHEGIVAGTVLGGNICLLHFTFVKNIEIWVKSTSKLQSEIIMNECVSFLKNDSK